MFDHAPHVRSVLLVGRDKCAGAAAVLSPLTEALAAIVEDVAVLSIAPRGTRSVEPVAGGLAPVDQGQQQADLPVRIRSHRWRPPFFSGQPATSARPRLGAPVADIWTAWPSRWLDEEAAQADVIVIQPDPGASLIARLRRQAPRATIVCYASEARDAERLSFRAGGALQRHPSVVDHVVVASRAMLPSFAAFARRVTFMPPGLETAAVDRRSRSPFTAEVNAVVMGPRPLDCSVVQIAATTLSDVQFHIVGPQTGHRYPPNVEEHGPLSATELGSFIRHASFGIVPFPDGPDAKHAADLSRELALFDHAGVPSVCPLPGAAGKSLRSGYEPGRSASIRAALARTLFMRTGQVRTKAPTWRDVAAHIVGSDGLATHTRVRVAHSR